MKSEVWNVCHLGQDQAAPSISATEDLDKLKLRHVTTEFSTKSREVIRVKSLSDSPVPTPRSRSERSDRSARSERESSFGIDASVPMDWVESGVCNLDDLLPPPEAYRDGERVLYWSQSLQQCASAVIVGRSGTICSGLVKSECP